MRVGEEQFPEDVLSVALTFHTHSYGKPLDTAIKNSGNGNDRAFFWRYHRDEIHDAFSPRHLRFVRWGQIFSA